jgi:5'-phosphate synthase pdxT subunit
LVGGPPANATPGGGYRPLPAGPIGVLALQGDFEAHRRTLDSLGATSREVRTPADLDGLSGLILPGGESTTMTLGAVREGLDQALPAVAAHGLPILATCAGMILLDRDHLGVLDIATQRNAFGRQIRSFESEVTLAGFGEPIHAVFIRAPWVIDHGPAVEPLGSVEDHLIAVRQGAILAVAFHPELTGETRLHSWLVELAARNLAR